ncbi:ABC transporter permease [Phaeacidiphilus oryzae]|uniref:ABC transporter permease n=1 Tax=Phaeacidiphilus oryzae TaxID=348818 RepID=UPI0005674EA7|nr:ABC transporter permease [Phaeacidiphilus oryzae]
MTRYLLRRLGQSVVTLFLASLAVFAGVRALPGDPALAMAGETPDPAVVAQIRHAYGFDRSLPVQYWKFLENAAEGNLGTSSQTGVPVAHAIAQAAPITVELALLSLLFAIVLGMGAGVLAAVRRGGPIEWMANAAALVGLSVPSFWLGIMLVLAFAIALPLFSASGFVPIATDPLDNLHRMVLPAVVLGSAIAAVVMRQTRSAMLESLSADYVRTARAKGLSRRQVVYGHALRNSLITVVTVLGLQLGQLISGAVVTEQIFVLPGFGKLTLDAVTNRDYAMVQGVVLCTAAAYIAVNLVVDLLYSVIDPRIRLGGAA